MGVSNNFIEKYTLCIHDDYLKRTRQQHITLEQRNRRYRLENNSRFFITKITVENCIINEHGQKGCEAILLIESAKNKLFFGEKAFYIELKGCSVRDALKQIDNSFERTKGLLTGIALFGRIVPSEYKRNKFLTVFQQKLHLKFVSTGGNLIIKEYLTDKV